MEKWEVQGGMKRNLALSIVGLSLMAILSFIIYREIVKSEAVAFDSCIQSIHENLIDAESASTIKLPRIEEWAYIGVEDIKRLEESRVFGDCHQLPSNKLIDVWGEKIQIVYRFQPRFHSYPPEFRVWSKGRDRLAGTDDDIISPMGSLETVKNLADRWP